MGRTAAGVRGIRLREGQQVISLIIAADGMVLNITENGYGKRTRLEEFTRHKRGGQGMIAIQTSERNGGVIGAILVNETDEIMLITSGGVLVRTRVSEISVVGRNTQGVRVIRLDKKEKVVGVDRVDGLEDETEESDEQVENEDSNVNSEVGNEINETKQEQDNSGEEE
jgi:DNA gyrase subunit A